MNFFEHIFPWILGVIIYFYCRKWFKETNEKKQKVENENNRWNKERQLRIDNILKNISFSKKIPGKNIKESDKIIKECIKF